MSNADLADFELKGKSLPRPGSNGWVVPALAWGLFLAVLIFAVPKFEQVFRDFGIELSLLNRIIVVASHQWLPILGVGVVVLVVDSIVRDVLGTGEDRRRLARCWSALMFGLPMLGLAIMGASLAMTLTALIEKLSG